MKILKYSTIALLVILLAFFGIGIFIPSFDYQVRVTVNAPPEKCWTVLHDTSRMEKWMTGFQTLTLKKGTGMTVGAVYEIVIQQDERYVMTEELTAIKKNELFSILLTNDVLTTSNRITLVPSGDQTHIDASYHVTGNNLFWKSLLWLSRSYLASSAQTQFTLLKVEIESGGMEF